jgi:hypothetical protein
VHMVKSVLTSVVAYHATVFDLPKWLIKKIDKFKRNFFWKGEEGKGNNDRICLVKWGMVCIPKELGGLKIMDLIALGELFARDGFGTTRHTTPSHVKE